MAFDALEALEDEVLNAYFPEYLFLKASLAFYPHESGRERVQLVSLYQLKQQKGRKQQRRVPVNIEIMNNRKL